MRSAQGRAQPKARLLEVERKSPGTIPSRVYLSHCPSARACSKPLILEASAIPGRSHHVHRRAHHSTRFPGQLSASLKDQARPPAFNRELPLFETPHPLHGASSGSCSRTQLMGGLPQQGFLSASTLVSGALHGLSRLIRGPRTCLFLGLSVPSDWDIPKWSRHCA